MLYREYEKASLKHLKACQIMLTGLNYQAKSISVQEKEYLLMDIFYLSGYTLECIINFALLKKVYKRNRWNDTKCVKKVVDSSLSFAFRCKDYQGNQYTFCIQFHNFWKNINLLDSLLAGNNIPLIGDKKSVPVGLLNMIENWESASRYHTHKKYNESDINALVELTEKVYNAIINPITGVGL